MVKKIWKDRKGAFAPITAILVVVLVIALAAMAYMALANTTVADGDDQDDEDLNGDDEVDPIIGFIELAVTVQVYNPSYSLTDTNDDVRFTIDSVEVSLVDELPTMSILDSMEWWDGSEDLKLVCTLKFPAYQQTLIKAAAHEWEQEYQGNYLNNQPITEYTEDNFYSGGIRYHGSYQIELVLYEYDDGWQECDRYSQAVSL